ncbi:MAG: HEAT repeat domain-containing protein [Planctomycetaceae bacterium]|nr:HEAT repeat domain-containing protein [Planctomycetaceae bacterium]
MVAVGQTTALAPCQQIDTLWLRWQAGDVAAMDSLISMGPAASSLSHRVLYPKENDEPSFPAGKEQELLGAMLADAMPELAMALPDLDEINREECFMFLDRLGGTTSPSGHGMCCPRQGRFVRPLAEILIKMYDSETDSNKDLILRVLAKANAGEKLRVTELQRGLVEYYFGDDSTAEFSGNTEKLNALLDVFEFRPEPAVADRIRDMANSHPVGYIRKRALTIFLSNNKDPILATNRLGDSESVEISLGEVSSRGVAIHSLLTYRLLPERIADRLLKLLYTSSFDESSLDPSDLCEAVCRCESFDDDSKQFIDRKIRELLFDSTSIEESCKPKLVRICAAAVVLQLFQDDDVAAEFLTKTISEPTNVPRYGAMGVRFRDHRAEAVRAFRRVPTQGMLRLNLLRNQLKLELPLHRGSDFCIECALTLASLDSQDSSCVEAIRGIDESTLLRLHVTWKEVQRILGDRAPKLIDLDQATEQVRSEAFIRDSSNPWEWQRLQPVASEIIPLLKNHLNSPNVDIRISAIHALKNLGIRTDLTEQLLLACLNDESIVVRIAAVDALSSIGASADQAIPQLQRLLHNDCLSLKIAAEDAISHVARTEPFGETP